VTVEDTHPEDIKFSYLTKFESEIRRFDTVMDLIQKFMPDDCKVWDRIAVVRDEVFKLQQQLRGVEIEVFAAPWIDQIKLVSLTTHQLTYFGTDGRKMSNTMLKVRTQLRNDYHSAEYSKGLCILLS
jgi:hypothetical protein